MVRVIARASRILRLLLTCSVLLICSAPASAASLDRADIALVSNVAGAPPSPRESPAPRLAPKRHAPTTPLVVSSDPPATQPLVVTLWAAPRLYLRHCALLR